MSDSNNKSSCLNCTEWEFFEGRGYGCFCMQTMTPIDAENCEFYHNSRNELRKEFEEGWKPFPKPYESKGE